MPSHVNIYVQDVRNSVFWKKSFEKRFYVWWPGQETLSNAAQFSQDNFSPLGIFFIHVYHYGSYSPRRTTATNALKITCPASLAMFRDAKKMRNPPYDAAAILFAMEGWPAFHGPCTKYILYWKENAEEQHVPDKHMFFPCQTAANRHQHAKDDAAIS